jgi:hypothetical protein
LEVWGISMQREVHSYKRCSSWTWSGTRLWRWSTHSHDSMIAGRTMREPRNEVAWSTDEYCKAERMMCTVWWYVGKGELLTRFDGLQIL